MENLRSAIVGLGFVGRAHLDALRRLGIPVQGILGTSPERSEEACGALGLDRAYKSLKELARDKSVDVVHVCTPNYVHFEQCKALIENGKHVVCEKPLAMDSGESATLVKLANKHKRAAAVAYNLRYYPLCQEARSMVERGLIGEPRLVHGGFLQDWLFYSTDWNWRLEPHLGGELRAVSDIGTHWLDLTSWITGRKVTELCADLATVIPTRKRPRGRVETFQQKKDGAFDEVKIATDDYASILLRLEGSVRGVMTVSQVSAGRKCRLWFEVNGSEGSLAWEAEDPNILWIGKRSVAQREPDQRPLAPQPCRSGIRGLPWRPCRGLSRYVRPAFQRFLRLCCRRRLCGKAKLPDF